MIAPCRKALTAELAEVAMASGAKGFDRRSWKKTDPRERTSNQSLWGRRFFVTFFLLAAVAVVVIMILYWILRPQTHMATITINEYPSNLLPIGFVTEDTTAFDPLKDRFYKRDDHEGTWSLRDIQDTLHLENLKGRLAGFLTGERDVLILYVALHGISEDGDPYILCSDIDPASPLNGRYAFEDFLQQLKATPSSLKLVLLDSGHLGYAPRMGQLINEFPRTVAKQLAALDDDNLWVLMSHSVMERSYSDYEAKRSLFSHYVELAFRGYANFDNGDYITLDELELFVQHYVSQCVSGRSTDTITQTPHLLWAGSGTQPELSEVRVMEALPFMPIEAPPTEDPEKKKAEEAAQVGPSGPTQLASQGISTSGLLSVGFPLPATGPLLLAQAQEQKQPAEPEKSSTEEKPAKDPKEPAEGEKTGDDGNPVAEAPVNAPELSKSPQLVDEKGNASGIRLYFYEAWVLRDELNKRQPGVWNPVDDAPHIWRDYQELLLGYETRFFSGQWFSNRDFRKEVEDNLLAYRKYVLEGQNPELLPSNTVAQRLYMARPQPISGVDQPHSLAMSRVLNHPARGILQEKLLPIDQQLDALSSQVLETDFLKLTDPGSLASQFSVYMEPAFALQLRETFGSREWFKVKETFQLRRVREQLAARGLSAWPWIADKFAEADRDLLFGEKEFLASVDRSFVAGGPHWERAEDSFKQIQRDIQTIERAFQVRNDALSRLPGYLKWFAEIGRVEPGNAPDFQTLKTLITDLHALSDLLENREASQLAEIISQTERVNRFYRSIEQQLYGVLLDLEDSATPVADSWKMEALLETTLPNANRRWNLWNRVLKNKKIRPIEEDVTISELQPLRPARPLDVADRNHIHQRAELELLYTSLAGRDALVEPLENLDKAFHTLDEAHRSFGDLSPTKDELWDAYRAFGVRLLECYEKFVPEYRALVPRPLEGKASPEIQPFTQEGDFGEFHTKLLRAERLLRLFNASQARKVYDLFDNPSEPSPAEQLHNRRVWQLLNWHCWQFDYFQTLKPWNRIDLNRAALSYRQQLSKLSFQPPPSKERDFPVYDVQIANAPSSVDCTEQGKAETVSMVIVNNSNRDVPMWATLEYNQQEVQIDSDPEVRHQTGSLLQPWQDNEPSFTIPAGRQRTVEFKVTSRRPQNSESRLSFRLETKGKTPLTERDFPVAMPQPKLFELVINRNEPDVTFGPFANRLYLRPFPIDDTRFEFGLRNLTPDSRQVTVELFALRRHPAAQRVAYPFDELGELIARVNPPPEKLALVGGLEITPGETAPLKFELGKVDPPKTETKATAAQDKKEWPPGPSIVDGLVVRVTDQTTGRKWLQRLYVSPLHPQTYLKAQAKYNQAAARLEITAEPADPGTDPNTGRPLARRLPANGSSVELAMSEIVDEQSSIKQAAQIPTIDSRQVQVWTGIKDEYRRGTVRVSLNVDGYPRAFTFDVRLSQGTSVRPLTDVTGIKITRLGDPLELVPPPEKPKAFAVPAEGLLEIPVEVEVDLPLNFFQLPKGQAIEIGVDGNDDGRPDAGSEIRFFAERDRQVYIRSLKDGVLDVVSRVGDLRANMPTQGLRNQKIALMAEIIPGDAQNNLDLDERTDVVEVVLDAIRPQIVRAPTSQVGIVGQPLEIEVQAEDNLPGFGGDGLSGVATVDGKLIVGDESSKVEGLRLGGGKSYLFKVETDKLKPGFRYLLEVQATDVVGNQSAVKQIALAVKTPPKKPPPPKPKNPDVKGFVKYGRQSISDVTVVLEGESSVPDAKTDNAGEFVFPNVKPGKYTLKVEAVVRNRIRRAEQTVTVPEPGKTLSPVTLKLE